MKIDIKKQLEELYDCNVISVEVEETEDTFIYNVNMIPKKTAEFINIDFTISNSK